MDERQVAINQIKEIHDIFHSGDRLSGSPRGLLLSGIICVLMSAVPWVARLWELGRIGTTSFSTGIVMIVVLALLLSNQNRQTRKELETIQSKNAAIHPLIKQSFGISNALLLSGAGLSIVWWFHTDRVLALWVINLGILANLWGRFVHNKVAAASYPLILGGIGLAAASEIGVNYEAIVSSALLFVGGWAIWVSFMMKKYQRS